MFLFALFDSNLVDAQIQTKFENVTYSNINPNKYYKTFKLMLC